MININIKTNEINKEQPDLYNNQVNKQHYFLH